MARPTYGIDAVALALAVILAAAIAFLVSQIMPPLADLMMPPRYEVIVGDQIVGRIVLFARSETIAGPGYGRSILPSVMAATRRMASRRPATPPCGHLPEAGSGRLERAAERRGWPLAVEPARAGERHTIVCEGLILPELDGPNGPIRGGEKVCWEVKRMIGNRRCE